MLNQREVTGIGRKKWWAESVADGQAREVGVVTKKLYRTCGCGGGGGLSQPVRGGWGQTSLKSTRTRETISNLLTPSAPNMQTFYLWNMVYEFGMGTAIGIYSKCYEGL